MGSAGAGERAREDDPADRPAAERERPGSGQPRFHTAAVIRDFTAAARETGSETSYVCAGTNFLA